MRSRLAIGDSLHGIEISLRACRDAMELALRTGGVEDLCLQFRAVWAVLALAPTAWFYVPPIYESYLHEGVLEAATTW